MKTFTEILSIPEAKQLVECIEELAAETAADLVKIRNNYIDELEKEYGYK